MILPPVRSGRNLDESVDLVYGLFISDRHEHLSRGEVVSGFIFGETLGPQTRLALVYPESWTFIFLSDLRRSFRATSFTSCWLDYLEGNGVFFSLSV